MFTCKNDYFSFNRYKMLRLLYLFIFYVTLVAIGIFLAWIFHAQKILFFTNIYYNIPILLLAPMVCLFIEHKIIWSKTIFFKSTPSILEPISMGIFIYLLYYFVEIIYELRKNNLYSNL